MGGRHAHGPSDGTRTSPRALGAVAALLLVAVLAMVWLWPDGAPPSVVQQGTQVDGVVAAVAEQPCPEAPASDPATASTQPTVCGTAQVRLTDGPDEGRTITTALPSGVGAPVLETGDAVVLIHSPGSNPELEYGVIDHQRSTQLWVLLAAFALSVIAFGRWRGLSALVGLAFTFAVLVAFVVPAILDGKPPLAVAIIGCAVIVLVVLYLTHGFGRTTTVALIGTLVSLVLTGLLSALAVTAMQLTGASDESSFMVGQTHGVDVRGLLLASILIGSLGVLDDVTITQSVTVEELAAASPTADAWVIYRAATRIGRAHIASVINTIVLAYAGASLPILVLILALDDPIGDILTDQLIATEIVRSAVGTMGLIAAVPVTTAAAAWLYRGRAAQRA